MRLSLLVVTGFAHRIKGSGKGSDMAKVAKQERVLRRGWTTGACAAAAAKAAFAALVSGEFPDPVAVTLPRGERPSFALAMTRIADNAATAGVIKDAGDDPDVTHGALICATVRLGAAGSGVTFRAGRASAPSRGPDSPLRQANQRSIRCRAG
jgi:cobalt-precorrin-5B (C1)-methyltransferase